MVSNCKKCGKIIDGEGLCPYCRGQELYNICKIDEFKYKRIGITLVPYCNKYDKRATKGDGYWICYNCKHFKGSDDNERNKI